MIKLLLPGAAILLVAGGAAAAGGAAPVGAEIAARWCAECHVVDDSQERAVADVPSFAEIAQRPDMDADALATFLAAPHPPMPDLSLSRQEIQDLVAYIESLE